MDITDNPFRIAALDEETVVLGVASVDTHGGPLAGEEMGGFTAPGIQHD
jgi:hypothetical protein